MIIPMSRTQPVEHGRWLALVANLPAEDPVSRMSMLRTLESLGAAVMREGVYLLPDTPASRNGLAHLAEYVGKISGSAQVLQVMPVSDAQQAAFRGLFDRSERYAALIKVIESMKVGFGIADPRVGLQERHHRQQRGRQRDQPQRHLHRQHREPERGRIPRRGRGARRRQSDSGGHAGPGPRRSRIPWS
jgi:hypothetical protein